MTTAKFFNTAGTLQNCLTGTVLTLIAQEKYFILHAPRQTGKTSSLLTLRDYPNEEGNYTATYANFEIGQAARNNE